MEKVVLVDMDDNEIGQEEKMAAHEKGLLHRAFSVFLFRGNEILIQKRASSKYHCGGLWTNTCCSHPRKGETVTEAAIRRLKEEMGINLSKVKEVDSIIYHYPFENGLTEFEFDHLLVGEYDGTWKCDPNEVDDVKWVSLDFLKEDIRRNTKAYTPWFVIALHRILSC